MGNCLFGGGLGPIDVTGNENHHDSNDGGVIKVVTTNGGIMEFCSPITVEFITDEFPGHGIFRTHDLFWKPLAHHEVLEAGESYHLLPLAAAGISSVYNNVNIMIRNGHVRSNSTGQVVETQVHNHHRKSMGQASYRMSFDSRGILKRSHAAANLQFNSVCSRNNYNGFWKVKLVISPQELLEILSQEARTQELIESVRTVAKCRNGGRDSPLLFSGEWSLSGSSSRKDNGCSNNQDASLINFF